MAAKKKTKRKQTGKSAKRVAQRPQAPVRRPRRAARKTGARSRGPALFRLNLEVDDLERAAAFYADVLGIEGVRHFGQRIYFHCGPVTLQVVDVSGAGRPHPAAKALYFSVRDLDARFARAQALGCLAREEVHGDPGGAIAVRPWGERSFYVEDPWGNPLCFVEAGTEYGQ